MHDLPAGTVTFLFTDIEGSTRLLKQLRDEYGAMLGAHRRLLREAFTAHRGQVVDMQGDAFFVVFERASDAVVAAMAAQAALESHEWPGGAQIRVRMGLHTGEALLSDEGYLGLAVHRTARICAAGHGGQILLSHSTATVVEDDVVPGLTVRDLGEHRLKDIDRPERIHQVLTDGQTGDERPPKPIDAQPMKATPFAGQERELAAAAHAAMSRRHSLIARFRQAIERPPGALKHAGSVLAEAAWDTTRTPKMLVAFGGLGIAALVVSPWLLAAGAAVFAYHVFVTARAVRFFHSPEGVGWRVHSIGNIAPDEALQNDLYDLAGALVRAGRVARSADVLIARTDRRRIVRELSEIRATGGAPSRADICARRLRTLDVLVDRRRAFDFETRRVDARVASVREQSFDARIDGRVPDDLASEVGGFAAKIAMLGASLADTYEEAGRYEPRAVGGRLRRQLPRGIG